MCIRDSTDNRRRIVGPSDGAWSAATTVRLGGGDATVAFELVKKGIFACFGVLRPGADRDTFLGNQQGGVGLTTNGRFRVDGSTKREGLPRISEGSRVVLEWRGGAQTLAWVVDGKRVLEHQGAFAGYDIAVGGFYGNTTIQLVEVREAAAVAAQWAEADAEWPPSGVRGPAGALPRSSRLGRRLARRPDPLRAALLDWHRSAF